MVTDYSMAEASDALCPTVSAFRAAVASRALNMLPSSVASDAVTSLASCGAPRVVSHQSLPTLVVIVLVLSGVVIGWAISRALAR